MTELLVAVLATFRLTRLLTFDDGPFDVFKRLRERAGIRIVGELAQVKIVEERFFAKLLDCHWCVGIWAAALVILLSRSDLLIIDYLLLVLAVAGGAAIVDSTLRSLGE